MKKLHTFLAIAVSIVGFEIAVANGFEGSCMSCQNRDGSCAPKWSTEKAKKHCWDIEAKPVCIPAVRLPWECCDTLKCGRVRCVNILKKQEYECEKNVVKWDASGVICPQPECRCSRCQDGCGKGCGNGCETVPMTVPESTPAPAPPAPVPPAAKRRMLFIPVVRR